MSAHDTGPRPDVWPGAWLTGILLVISIAALVIAWDFVPATTRYFPLLVSAACIAVAAVDLARRFILARRIGRGRANLADANAAVARALATYEPNAAADAPVGVILRYAAWFFGFLAGIWVASVVIAAGVFVAAFLRFEAGSRWWTAALSGLAVVGLVLLAGNVFHIRWPDSLIDPLALLR